MFRKKNTRYKEEVRGKGSSRAANSECTRSFPYMPATRITLPPHVPSTLLRRLHSQLRTRRRRNTVAAGASDRRRLDTTGSEIVFAGFNNDFVNPEELRIRDFHVLRLC